MGKKSIKLLKIWSQETFFLGSTPGCYFLAFFDQTYAKNYEKTVKTNAKSQDLDFCKSHWRSRVSADLLSFAFLKFKKSPTHI